MVHEVPDIKALFEEVGTILAPTGSVLMVEPPVHVSKKAFEAAVTTAREVGLVESRRPKVFFGKAVVLKRNS